jgi:hypothetical protein
VQELNFQELAVEEVRLKIKTIRTRNAAELAKVIRPGKSGAGLHYFYVPKLFWLKQKYINSCEAFLFTELRVNRGTSTCKLIFLIKVHVYFLCMCAVVG